MSYKENEHVVVQVDQGLKQDVDSLTTQLAEKASKKKTDTWVDIKQDFNASGSIQTYTGSITAGSKVLTLTTTSDFQKGQGLEIIGANINGWDFITTIESVNGTTITLTQAASTTVSNVTVYHDDSKAIKDAIAYLGSTGGDIIFPSGIYLTSKITLPANIRLKGVGKLLSTIRLQRYSNSHLIEIIDSANTNISLENLVLDGNSGVQSLTNLNVLHVDDITSTTADEYYLFKDLLVLNAKKDGVYVGRQIREARFNNVVSRSSGNHGFNIDATDSFFLQCTSLNSGAHGFNITGANLKFVSCKAFYSGNNYANDNSIGDGFYLDGSLTGGNHNQFTACESQENGRHGYTLNGVHDNILESIMADTNGRLARKIASNYNIVNSQRNTIIGTSSERTGLNGELLSSLNITDNTSTTNHINLRHYVKSNTVTQMLPISGVKPFVDNTIIINNDRYETYDQLSFNLLDTNNDGIVDGFTSGDISAGVTKTFSIDYGKQCQIINVTTATNQYSGSYIYKDLTCFPNDKINVFAFVKSEVAGTVCINVQFLDSGNAVLSNTTSSNIHPDTLAFTEVSIKDFTIPANTTKARVRIDVFNATAGGAAKGLIKSFKASVTR